MPYKKLKSTDDALKQIIDGYMHFHEVVYPQQEELFRKLAFEQMPKAMFITCADARVVPELITQTSPGDLFVTRNVGNVVPPYGQMLGGVSTAIEYAVVALGVKHLIICGHSDCGAMKAVLDPSQLKDMPTVRAWLQHSEVAKIVVQENCGHANESTLGILTEENVVAQLGHLSTHPSVASRLARGDLFIHGWVYDIETSQIRAYDTERGEFRRIGDGPLPMATPKPRY